MLIDLIAGARPNFMKIAPITHAIQKVQDAQMEDPVGQKPMRFRLIHTGQHYDKNMSDSFFDQLNIPRPDVNLGAGGGSQAEQTAAIMTGYEKLLTEQEKPDLTIVVGDVTSTMACSITAKKLGVHVAHVEGGIRSRDWTMPEEINRVTTDSISDYFFTTSEIANNNLRSEGVEDERIFFVGNTMIDTLYAQLDRLRKPAIWDDLEVGQESKAIDDPAKHTDDQGKDNGDPVKHTSVKAEDTGGLTEGRYFVMTLHRPANVDEEQKLGELLRNIAEGAGGEPIIFPTHPRTRNILNRLGLTWPNLHYVDPLGYLEFIYLVKRARAVITDSGGITEETTVLGVPCLTLRDNTERPETITQGTNELIGTDPAAIRPALERLMSGTWKSGSIPEKWDGKTAERIVEVILQLEASGGLEPHRPFRDEQLLLTQ